MIKTFLILGFVRSGTTGFAKYLNISNKNNNLKVKSRVPNKKKFEAFVNCERFKLVKNKFFVFTPWKKKFFSPIKKKDLFLKKVLITHYFNKKIFKIFENREIILMIRKPLDTISSLISYTTKKEVISYNSKYKIRDPQKLVLKKKIINKHIKHYEDIYINFCNPKYSSKIKVLNYELFDKIKFKKGSFYKKNIKSNNYHSSNHSNQVREYLKNNYNFAKAEKIYKKIIKFKRFKFQN